MAHKPEELIGAKFGKLTVLQFSHKDTKSNNYYECLCDCGNSKQVAQNHLLSGKIRSCGCLKNKRTRVEPDMNTEVASLQKLLRKHLNTTGMNAVFAILGVLNEYMISNKEYKCYRIVSE
jgi:hypothetical protein